MTNNKPNKRIRLSKSFVNHLESNALAEVIKDSYLGMGTYVQSFEDLLSNYFGRPVVCVSSGTAALHLALQAANIGKDDEVLIQSLTYVASFQSISATGAIPVPCDINPSSMTLDLNDVEKRLTDNTKAIMPVHYAGGVGNLSEIYEFANINGIRVIEDAAHAFGSYYNYERVGSFGDITCFSFDGIKNITCGEGGCIVSDDENIIDRIKDLRLLGVIKDSDNRYLMKRSWEFDVREQGWRYHMSNLNASIGIQQFNKLPKISKVRRDLASLYVEKLLEVDNVTPVISEFSQVVPHIFPVILDDKIDRDELRKKLLEEGIETGIHYYPNHLLTIFSSDNRLKLKNTEKYYPLLLSLPLHPEISNDEINHICKKLNFFVNHASLI